MALSDPRGGWLGPDTKVLTTGALGVVLFVMCALVTMNIGVVPSSIEAPDNVAVLGLASAGIAAIGTIALGGRFVAEPAKFWPRVVAGGVLAGIGLAVAYGVMMGSGIVSMN